MWGKEDKMGVIWGEWRGDIQRNGESIGDKRNYTSNSYIHCCIICYSPMFIICRCFIKIAELIKPLMRRRMVNAK